ncbi:MAG: sugar-binding domain-containing protein [Bacteroidota bacterium]
MLKIHIFLVVLGCSLFCCDPPVGSKVSQRESDFNTSWHFQLTQSLEDAADDSRWKPVKIPHDWSIGLPYDSALNGATAYLPGGVGWYRKEFDLSVSEDEVVYLLFDGVYNRSTVWLNGHELGFHPYGYSPFYYNLAQYLVDGKNELTVRVDRTRYIDSRWYTGSGIYRNVELIRTNKLHIPIWGTFITTPEITAASADVAIDVEIRNYHNESKAFDLATKIYDASGNLIAQVHSDDEMLSASSSRTFPQRLQLDDPVRWDVDNPALYTAKTTIHENDRLVDEEETVFGIRDFRFDAASGFYLNGRNMKIKGVCLHHDGGSVGTAVPRGVWRRRLSILKDAGVNAIRMAHNPSSKELLELCDELGFLVQDEFFDEWDYPKDKRLNQEERHDDYISRGSADYFQAWAEADLKNTMRAHRNHASIFQWSIGNEIEWTYHPRYRNITGYFDMKWDGNYFWDFPPTSPEIIAANVQKYPPRDYELAKTAQKLSDWTREMDTTRVVTANCILPIAGYETGYADALDVVGFSYRRVVYDYAHANYPNKPIMGTENLPQWHEWKAVMERPFVPGVFLWTGIDYMGESNGAWPRKTLPSGLIDQAGFPNGSYYMFKSLWVEDPVLQIATQREQSSLFTVDEIGDAVEKDPGSWSNRLWIWQDVNEHWNYQGNDLVMVEVYSNCEEVELFFNDKSLGKRRLEEFPDRIYKWGVRYSPGTLKAVGTRDGVTVEQELKTAGAATGLRVAVDKDALVSDGYDVAHLVVQLVDNEGNPVRRQEAEVSFEVSGPVRIIGIDNGAPDNLQPNKGSKILTDEGSALLILQSTREKGSAKVFAKSSDMPSVMIDIEVN